MIRAQPKSPGVVIEGQRKTNADREQDGEHRAVAQIREQQAGEICEQDKYFGGHHIRHDRADEEPFFAFEDDATRVASMLQIERPLHNRCAATDWTLQFETALKRERDCARISFHQAIKNRDFANS